MELNESKAPPGEPQPTPAGGAPATNPAEAGVAQPIAELLSHPDFPRCAIGKQVDIGGVIGLVVDVVKHSLKLRDREGVGRSYNVHTLRKLYGPTTPPEPAPERQAVEPPPLKPSKPEVKREIITNPNFDVPVKSIEEFVNRPDFPKCTFGQHLDLRGYIGVVVEVVNRSLKVRSREGATHSYNADGLRRLYAKPPTRSS